MIETEVTEVFATAIEIRKVRHLENIKIEISETQRKHLILTGKNGSGKTSVLEALREVLHKGLEQDMWVGLPNIQSGILGLIQHIKQMSEKFALIKTDEERMALERSIKNTQQNLEEQSQIIYSLENPKISFSNFEILIKQCKLGNFLLAYFNARRNNPNQNTYHSGEKPIFFNKTNGVRKINFSEKYAINVKTGNLLIQYLVNLHFDRLEAKDSTEIETVNQIDKWFQRFENSLQDALDEANLKLAYNRQERTYEIKLGNGLTVDFNALSDGYSSIMIIVAELIMRMEAMNARNYDLQGIVLIDEIETHLHIDLQKKILPFLTTFFPKIQFIVTTHSPFVLNSIPNAVVFDLEKQIRVEDLSAYSASGIVEGYFGNDQYSEALKKELELYEQLVQQNNLGQEEEEKILDIRQKFKKIPQELALEAVFKFQQIELNRLTRKA